MTFDFFDSFDSSDSRDAFTFTFFEGLLLTGIGSMFLILAALPLATALTNCEKFSRPSAATVKMKNPDQSFEDAFFKKASRVSRTYR